jgi:Tfp pilus assembly protein PilF
MKKLLLGLCLLSNLIAYAADTPSSAEPSSSERMSAAQAAIKTKNWPAAITELKAVVKSSPRDADAHNLLAYSYRKQAKPDLTQAFEHYRIALKLNPDHKGAHEYIGEAYLIDKKPVEAEKHLTELKRICGNTSCEEYIDLSRAIAQYKKQQ